MSEKKETYGCPPCPKCGGSPTYFGGTSYDWRCSNGHTGRGDTPERCPTCDAPVEDRSGLRLRACKCSKCGHGYPAVKQEFDVPNSPEEIKRMSDLFTQPPHDVPNPTRPKKNDEE